VIVNVQRGGPSTGLPTHASQGDVNQARWGTHGDHAIIALTASNHQDMFGITVEAFNLAETYRTPVVLLFDEVTAHMRERLLMPKKGDLRLVERLRTSVTRGVDYRPYLPREDGRLPMSDFGGEHRYNVTGLFHDMWGFPSDNPKIVHGLMHHLIDKIRNNITQIVRYREYYLEDAKIILISYGSAARSSRHVVESRRDRGEKFGLLELQTLRPFPADMIREFGGEVAFNTETVIYEHTGCDACHSTGYRGREAIYEFLVIDDDIRRLILGRATANEIKTTAIASGMKTLRQSGWEKVKQGVTTLQEVIRVTQGEA